MTFEEIAARPEIALNASTVWRIIARDAPELLGRTTVVRVPPPLTKKRGHPRLSRPFVVVRSRGKLYAGRVTRARKLTFGCRLCFEPTEPGGYYGRLRTGVWIELPDGRGFERTEEVCFEHLEIVAASADPLSAECFELNPDNPDWRAA